MAAAAFLGCFCTGHGCWPPRPGVTASSDVFVNGIPVHRENDVWLAHCCPDDGCHPGVVSSGAGNVNINGRAAARMGDDISCGSKIAMGSPNVDFGAPMSTFSTISGSLGLAGQFGIEIPSLSDVLSNIGLDFSSLDLGQLDVTDWVSENLLNGAVLPAELLGITENLTSLVKNGPLLELANSGLDLAKFSNILTPGGGITGAINLGTLQTLADGLGIKASQLIGQIESTGVLGVQGSLSDALKMGLDTLSLGIRVDQIKKVGEVLNVNVSQLGLPDLNTILQDRGVNLSADKLTALETAISAEQVGSPALAGIIANATGLSTAATKNIVGQITGITLPYVQSKVNAYIENNTNSSIRNASTITTARVMNAVKTKITLDIKAETGGVIFL